MTDRPWDMVTERTATLCPDGIGESFRTCARWFRDFENEHDARFLHHFTQRDSELRALRRRFAELRLDVRRGRWTP